MVLHLHITQMTLKLPTIPTKIIAILSREARRMWYSGRLAKVSGISVKHVEFTVALHAMSAKDVSDIA